MRLYEHYLYFVSSRTHKKLNKNFNKAANTGSVSYCSDGRVHIMNNERFVPSATVWILISFGFWHFDVIEVYFLHPRCLKRYVYEYLENVRRTERKIAWRFCSISWTPIVRRRAVFIDRFFQMESNCLSLSKIFVENE